MNRLILAAAVVIGTTAVASAGPRGDALDDITDAMDIVDGASSQCYRSAMSELTAIQGFLREDSNRAALQRIRSLKRSVDRCPRAVGRLLRSAEEALEDARRDRRDRRRDDWRDDRRDDRRDDWRDDRRAEPKKPEPPKRAEGVPYADFNRPCIETWMIHEIARDNTSQATMDQLGANSSMACGNASGVGRASYQNGTLMHTDNGDWYYPNGTMARSSSGAYYYPNGTMAKSSNGDWYFPNGTMAKSSSGTWYYPNGSQAGGWQVIEGWGCQKAGDYLCKRYKGFLASDVEDWRSFALVQLATLANRAR